MPPLGACAVSGGGICGGGGAGSSLEIVGEGQSLSVDAMAGRAVFPSAGRVCGVFVDGDDGRGSIPRRTPGAPLTMKVLAVPARG